jgi:chemotaxis protein CheC
MQLTFDQSDALAELINIGYGRAAAALSELTGYRITLEAPSVGVYSLDEVCARLDRSMSGSTACVNQAFSGPITGNAMLLLDEPAAVILSKLLDKDAAGSTLDASSREVITEAGNILLNACLGTFGNLLEVQVTFAVPNLQVESVPTLLRTMTAKGEPLTHGLLFQTQFYMRTSNVTGYLVMILGVTSLERLIVALERWENL